MRCGRVQTECSSRQQASLGQRRAIRSASSLDKRTPGLGRGTSLMAGALSCQGSPPPPQTRGHLPQKERGRKAHGAATGERRTLALPGFKFCLGASASPGQALQRVGRQQHCARGQSVPMGSLSCLIKAMEFTRGFQHILPSRKPHSCLQASVLL